MVPYVVVLVVSLAAMLSVWNETDRIRLDNRDGQRIKTKKDRGKEKLLLGPLFLGEERNKRKTIRQFEHEETRDLAVGPND